MRKSHTISRKKLKLTDISDSSKIKTGQIDPEQYMRVKHALLINFVQMAVWPMALNKYLS